MRLKRIGVAEVVPVKKVTVQRLRSAVRKVLGDRSYLERARFFEKQIHELNGLEQAAKLVDDGLHAMSSSNERTQFLCHSSE